MYIIVTRFNCYSLFCDFIQNTIVDGAREHILMPAIGNRMYNVLLRSLHISDIFNYMYIDCVAKRNIRCYNSLIFTIKRISLAWVISIHVAIN